MAAEACEIELPEDLLSVISATLSRASPRDACRAAAVSRAFRAAADSDAVWSCHLPRDLPPLADGELSPAPPSKKELFLQLSDRPVLLPDGLMSMWLDRETGAKCYMLSARALVIDGENKGAWGWIPLADSRFAEGAELLDVRWLEIRGKINIQLLSQNSTYSAYMVFKMANGSYELHDRPVKEASVSVGEARSTSEDDWEDDSEDDYPDVNEVIPVRRADGWMELDLGEYFIEEGEDGEVTISLVNTTEGKWKKDIIVHGFEIRLTRSG